jgi:probable phosphoglycerate mutase
MIHHNEFYLSLIRHGQSAVNIQPDMMGQAPDTPLTDKGISQAALLGQRLKGEDKKFDYVFTSDYIRAYNTAKIAMGEDYPMIVSSALREYSAGDWDGASRKEIQTERLKLRMAAMTNAFCPPNGESLHMVERRASQWLEDTVLYNEGFINETAARHELGLKPMEIAVFSHGMTIKCLLHYIMGFDQSFTWKLTLENTSISKLHFGMEGWRLLTINDHAHLL